MILPAVTEIKSLLTNDAALPLMIAAFGETLANTCNTDKHVLLASVLDTRFKLKG